MITPAWLCLADAQSAEVVLRVDRSGFQMLFPILFVLKSEEEPYKLFLISPVCGRKFGETLELLIAEVGEFDP